MGRRPLAARAMTPAQRQRRWRAGQCGLPLSHATASLAPLIASGHRFGAILADPPWTFETRSDQGKGRSAERHYGCMPLPDIKAMPVAALASDHCALFMWTTFPHMQQALEVIEAWGFRYVTTAFVWVKETPKRTGLHWGLGYWTRANAEPCLLATRGNPKRLARDVHQIVTAPVTTHSRKPDEVHHHIERLVPGPYLEVFARRPHMGWTVFGAEVNEDDDIA